MDKDELFQQFLAGHGIEIPLVPALVNLLLAGLLGYLTGRVYVHCGAAFANRQLFARNLLLICMTTMFIITIIKASIALSLGLVGALSIVRFRTAIKEPEELGYLFVAIAFGLGLGAGQRQITFAAFLVIAGVLLLRHRFGGHPAHTANLFLTIRSTAPERTDLQAIVRAVEAHCRAADLQRYDRGAGLVEVTLRASFAGTGELERLVQALRAQDETVEVTFVEEQGVAV